MYILIYILHIFTSGNSTRYRINSTPYNTYLEPEIRAKLNTQFAFEIELYNFCKQRLYKQYIAIKKEELMKKFESRNSFLFNIWNN